MEGEGRRDTSAGRWLLDMSCRRDAFLLLFFLYLVTLVITFSVPDRWGLYQLSASVNFLLFCGVVLCALRSGFLEELYGKGDRWSMFILFAVPLVIQFFMLKEDPSFSQDIMRLQFRGEGILGGLVPYEELEVNKPPLYIWIVAGISRLFGTDQLVFRTFFVVLNSLIPPLMFFIGTSSAGKDDRILGWRTGAFAYALWPVAMIETGIAGHFDPMVALVVLLSFIGLRRRRYASSGILIGAALALKMYPVLLVPIFLLTAPNIRKGVVFITGAVSVPLISAVPFVLEDPSAMAGYILYQSSGWGVSLSIRYAVDMALSAAGLPAVLTFFLMTALLGLGTLAVLAAGIKGRIPGYLTWILYAGLSALVVISSVFFSVLLFVASRTLFHSIIGAVPVLIGLVLIIMAGAFIRSEGPQSGHFGKGPIGHRFRIGIGMVPQLSAVLLVILLLTSAQFHPWYLIWVAPFAFGAGGTLGWTFLTLSGPLHYLAYAPWDLGHLF